jgi:TM2 domain-containing membrane protein YozV
MSDAPEPKKKMIAMALIVSGLGTLGAHRFYTGHIVPGVIQLLTLGGCGIWTFIDLIMIVTGKFKDANGQELV